MNRITNKLCVSYKQGKCNALRSANCSGCKFFKTEKEDIRDRYYCKKRLIKKGKYGKYAEQYGKVFENLYEEFDN